MDREELEFLEGGNYLNFSTRKKSGEWVNTPVWFAPHPQRHPGSYFVFSAGGAGKVKRLRNFSDCRVAACTATGTLTGPWREMRAYVLEATQDEAMALEALRDKYGWQMKIGDLSSRLTGKMARRAYIRIDPVAGK
jgi:PPOX class probable F420-dependent enzyme